MLGEIMFAGMADPSVVFQLDALFVGLTALTLLHAIANRGVAGGTAVVLYLVFHTAAFEHISLFLGGTHCHASSSVLPMVTPCSSVNSVLFYLPWTYSSLAAARRLNLHPVAFPFAVGLLQFGFGAVYEMQGPYNSFWKWPDTARVIADSAVLLPYEHYPDLGFLAEAKRHGEVATITNGLFRASEHAATVLAPRLYGFPLLAPYFHFAFGFAWAAGLGLTGDVGARAVPSLRRLAIAGVLSVVLFLPPIWITRLGSEALGLPLIYGVSLSLAASFLPILLLGRRDVDSSRPLERGGYLFWHGEPQPTDALLFAISVIMQVFMVSFPWRAVRPTPPGLVALVAATGGLHLVAQYLCCFVVAAAPAKQKIK